MAQISIRDDLYDRLSKLAETNHVSVDQQAETMLGSQLGPERPAIPREELIARLEAVAAMTPKDRPQTDSTLLLREERDR